MISISEVGPVHQCLRAFISPYNPSVNMSDHNVKWRLAECFSKFSPHLLDFRTLQGDATS